MLMTVLSGKRGGGGGMMLTPVSAANGIAWNAHHVVDLRLYKHIYHITVTAMVLPLRAVVK